MSSTRVDVLVDANVFVYTYVTAEPEKRARALDALDRLVLHGGRAALGHQIPLILTQDFVHGRVLEGVQFLDPFGSAFELAALD